MNEIVAQTNYKALTDEDLIRIYTAMEKEFHRMRYTSNDRLQRGIELNERMTQIDEELKRRYPA